MKLSFMLVFMLSFIACGFGMEKLCHGTQHWIEGKCRYCWNNTYWNGTACHPCYAGFVNPDGKLGYCTKLDSDVVVPLVTSTTTEPAIDFTTTSSISVEPFTITTANPTTIPSTSLPEPTKITYTTEPPRTSSTPHHVTYTPSKPKFIISLYVWFVLLFFFFFILFAALFFCCKMRKRSKTLPNPQLLPCAGGAARPHQSPEAANCHLEMDNLL